jgi:hypothetical protein
MRIGYLAFGEKPNTFLGFDEASGGYPYVSATVKLIRKDMRVCLSDTQELKIALERQGRKNENVFAGEVVVNKLSDNDLENHKLLLVKEKLQGFTEEELKLAKILLNKR